MKNIVITGATSFIGLRLLEILSSDMDNHVYALVRSNSINKYKLGNKKNVSVIEVGLENIDKLASYVQCVDQVYHLAWNGTRVPERYDRNLQESNFKYSIETYNVVKKLGCSVFIGIGSQAEYGYIQDDITEDLEARPNTAYGEFKLATCNKLIELGEEDNIRIVWGRVFSIYGENDYSNTLIMSTIDKMLRNEDIDMTEGTQYWNYLYVQDLAKIITLLGKNECAKGIYNLASNDTRMLKDYIIEIKNILKSDSNINFGAVAYRKEGKVNIRPRIDKLIDILFQFNFMTFSEGINHIVRNRCADVTD